MIVLPGPEQIVAFSQGVKMFPGVLLYVGPDQIMPLTSVLGALVGIALMFWNRLVGLAYKCLALLGWRAESPHKPSAEQ